MVSCYQCSWTDCLALINPGSYSPLFFIPFRTVFFFFLMYWNIALIFHFKINFKSVMTFQLISNYLEIILIPVGAEKQCPDWFHLLIREITSKNKINIAPLDTFYWNSNFLNNVVNKEETNVVHKIFRRNKPHIKYVVSLYQS